MNDGSAVHATQPGVGRWLVVTAVLLGSFFGAYRYAEGRSATAAPPQVGVVGVPATSVPGGAAAPASSGCACCGSSAPTQHGLTGDLDEGVAAVSDGVQRIDVDLSKGYYSPNQIVLQEGVPAEITFGQGSGCTAQIMSKDLGFFEDLSAGPKTVKLPALAPGEYAFSCGMEMVFGKIVVQ